MARRQSDTRFFFEYTGWRYDPKTETSNQGRWRRARDLVEAEREAHVRGWTYRWEWDDDQDSGCCECTEPESGCPCARGECGGHEVLGCILQTTYESHADSLWGISDPSEEDRRVIEAELASEHLADIQHALMQAI
jgi:hypothetical protein